MSDEHGSDRDYRRGYEDGRSGKDYPTPSVLDILAGAVMPGDPAGPSEDYDEGYRSGAEDRKHGR